MNPVILLDEVDKLAAGGWSGAGKLELSEALSSTSPQVAVCGSGGSCCCSNRRLLSLVAPPIPRGAASLQLCLMPATPDRPVTQSLKGLVTHIVIRNHFG